MKKLLKFLTLFVFAGNLGAQTPNFTVTSNTGSFSITCAQTTLSLTASTFVNPPVTFHWLSATSSFTGSSIIITQAGTYTVTALDSLNMVFGTQYITISSNTVAPSSAVSPLSQNIACGATAASFTSVASGNVTHTFLSPYGGSVIINSAAAVYAALGTGTYTHVLLNNVNGCQSSTTFTITGIQGFPTFNVSSPQNYTLGCNSTSLATILITNAATTSTLGGAVSYSLVLFPGSPAPSGPLSNVSVYNVTIPGLYYVIVRDNTTNCTTQIPITIISNTSAPNISASVPNQILSCDSSQVLLQALTTATNTSISWNFMGTPGTTVGSSIIVHSNPATPTQTTVNIYTLTITDLSNTCKSMSVIPVYQNLFPPKAIISSGGISALTCLTNSIVLINQSSTGIPHNSTFPVNQPVVGYLWQGPMPQTPLQMSSLYTAATPGVYTLTVKDLNNGCLSQTTTIITDNRIYPNITPPSGSFFLPCPGTVIINAIINGPMLNSYSYLWSAPSGAIVSGTSSSSLTTNSPGDYTLSVVNTITGCSSTEIYRVYSCVGLTSNSAISNLQLFPNPTNGVFTIVSEGLQKTSAEIYNSIGVLVKKQILNSDKTILNMEGEAAGIYIIHLIQNGSLVHTLKIVKE